MMGKRAAYLGRGLMRGVDQSSRPVVGARFISPPSINKNELFTRWQTSKGVFLVGVRLFIGRRSAGVFLIQPP